MAVIIPSMRSLIFSQPWWTLVLLTTRRWLLAAILTVLFGLPLWVMAVLSLRGDDPTLTAAGQSPLGLLWVATPVFSAYERLWQQAPIGLYVFNSVWVAVVTTIIHVFLCALGGYALSRFPLSYRGFNLKPWVFALMLGTLMVPPAVNVVPLFWIMARLHWVDTPWALVVPGLFGGYGVYLFRQWFESIPPELELAARLDGCNGWQTFWHIALPLARPVVLALGLFVAVGCWNSFLWPLMVTQSEQWRTLPVGIAALKSTYRDVTDWPVLMAAATTSVAPLLVLMAVGQRHWVAGLMAGGLKE